MEATANEMFQQLVQTLYASHLHFYLSETPFSAQICIRKKFLKDRPTTNASSTGFNSRNETAFNQITELQKKVESSDEIINILESKLEEAESKVLKAFNDKKIEIDTLKNSIKKSDQEVRNLRKDLNDERKLLKEKERNIQKLELKCEKLVNDSKNVKTELIKVKNENKKLLKSKQPSKKVLVPNPEPKASEIMDEEKSVDAENDSNHNLQPAVLSEQCSTPPVRPAGSPSRTLQEVAKCVTTTPVQLASMARNNLSPALPAPVAHACSPHTPPGTPPPRRSPSSVSTLTPTSTVTTGTCGVPLQTSAIIDSTSQPRPADSTSTVSRALPITEDYIAGINQLDLGPRVNDLSKMFQ